jgi:hypothetical protein
LTTVIAKLASHGILLSAPWADKLKFIATFVAELGTLWIFKLAFWAFHLRSPRSIKEKAIYFFYTEEPMSQSPAILYYLKMNWKIEQQ